MTESSCFELSTLRQLCSNGYPLPSEEVPDGLCHSLSVDPSSTAWAQTGSINELSGNTFGTGRSDSVKIGAGPSYATLFGTVSKIRAQTVQTVSYLLPIDS